MRPLRQAPTAGWLLAWTAALALSLGGCVAPQSVPVADPGGYCQRIGKHSNPTLTCIAGSVPGPAAEAQAKRFEPDAQAFTLYVLRRRWGDTRNVVVVLVDGRPAPTAPASLMRLKLQPGAHRLGLTWDGGSDEILVPGTAGELQFVELVGKSWSWGGSYHWERGSTDALRDRAMAATLIADIDLR